MDDLRAQLEEAREGGARRVLVVTDGAFSMDGYLAPLAEICDLAEEHAALVMVDDSVVPKGEARIRVQLSAAHSEADVRRCVDAFVQAREAVSRSGR